LRRGKLVGMAWGKWRRRGARVLDHKCRCCWLMFTKDV
jgi:hypothetical protein